VDVLHNLAARQLTRRRFLTSAAGVAGLSVAGLGGATRTLSAADLRSRRPVGSFLPDPQGDDLLRTIARTAIDAATAAGATYADVRVADRHGLSLEEIGGLIQGFIEFDHSYGIRACVNGVWGFGYGTDPTPEGVREAAAAVVRSVAQLPAAFRRTGPVIAPAPVANGHWETPVGIDPFVVSSDDHVAVIMAFRDAVGRVQGAQLSPALRWEGETRVFASSEGSLVTQRLLRALPLLRAGMYTRDPTYFREWFGDWSPSSVIGGASAGFEITEGAALQEQFKAYAELRERWTRLPRVRHFPVGRYNTVFDGETVGELVGQSLAPALSLGRALGLAGDSQGISVFTPIESYLGAAQFSPLLHVTADRSVPHLGAAKWDDEGVATQSFDVIQKGAIKEYFGTRVTNATMRETNPSVAEMPLRGCAMTMSPLREPIGISSSLRVNGPEHGPTFDELVRQVNNGVVVMGGGYASMNESLSHGMLMPRVACEVKRGEISRLIISGGIQFSTKQVWKQLSALGGSTTTQSHMCNGMVGQPAMWHIMHTQAPAALFRDVSVIDLEQVAR